jgi:hypothetical protein
MRKLDGNLLSSLLLLFDGDHFAPHQGNNYVSPSNEGRHIVSKDKNVMARARKYYLKNNYLTLMSKVKVQRRSLWYTTHRLMVMHPHTKYH